MVLIDDLVNVNKWKELIPSIVQVDRESALFCDSVVYFNQPGKLHLLFPY